MIRKCTPLLFLTAFLSASITLLAQNEYRYSVDLTNPVNNTLPVELLVPAMNKSTATFSFPKIIPGTYAVSDYGVFITDMKAFNKAGKSMPVTKISEDKWKITNATTLAKLTYKVNGIFSSQVKHSIYPMAATNIEQGKNYVIHTPGFFGYFDGYTRVPYTLSFTRPDSLYASTSLNPVQESAGKDVFKVSDADALYDSPIMYTVPDTTTVQVGNCRVLVSVYSPGQQIQSKQVAEWMSDLLDAARQYLGGRLPADKYAFLYYFKDASLKHNFPPGLGGALEHTTSSFYYLPNLPANVLKPTIVNTSSHEFFHIITPLTIASKEIKEFNYDKPVLSKHLWLYEGVTEYTAHLVQVKYGLQTVPQFLAKLSEKITRSRTNYNDTLPFTVLSKEAAGKYAKEYGNVYEKGALIGACLDIYLLHLSNGNYGLRNLEYDLGIRFGKKRSFNDEELFGEIRDLTYPEIEEFLRKYVDSSTPIPYDYFFGLAGIKYTPQVSGKVVSFGGFAPVTNKNGVLVISPQSRLNDFGRSLGLKVGDELYAINGINVGISNIVRVLDSLKSVIKEGDKFEMKVGRKNDAGSLDTVTLSTSFYKVTQNELNKLEPMSDATAKQRLVQKIWLSPVAGNVNTTAPAANPADVSSIDAIIKATYDVISGPAGIRNWDRFNSLFLPDAKMGATARSMNGQSMFRSFIPAEYQRRNAPYFSQSGFYEEELKRNVSQFGNVATVASSYQYRMEPNGKVEQRGINYFTLVNSEGRWWIANLSWQDEDELHKLPAGFEK